MQQAPQAEDGAGQGMYAAANANAAMMVRMRQQQQPCYANGPMNMPGPSHLGAHPRPSQPAQLQQPHSPYMSPQFINHNNQMMSAQQMRSANSNDQAQQFHQQRTAQPSYVFTTDMTNRAEQEVNASVCANIIEWHQKHYTLGDPQQAGPSSNAAAAIPPMSNMSNGPKLECMSPSMNVKSPACGPASVPTQPRTPRTPQAIKQPSTPLALHSTDKQNIAVCSTSLPNTPNTTQAPNGVFSAECMSMMPLHSAPLSVPQSTMNMHNIDVSSNPLLQMERMAQESMRFEQPLKQARLGSPRAFEAAPVTQPRSQAPAAKRAKLSAQSSQNETNNNAEENTNQPIDKQSREEKMNTLKMMQNSLVEAQGQGAAGMPPQYLQQQQHMMWAQAQHRPAMNMGPAGTGYVMHPMRPQMGMMDPRLAGPMLRDPRTGQPMPMHPQQHRMFMQQSQREMEMNAMQQHNQRMQMQSQAAAANKPVMAVPPNKRPLSYDPNNEPNGNHPNQFGAPGQIEMSNSFYFEQQQQQQMPNGDFVKEQSSFSSNGPGHGPATSSSGPNCSQSQGQAPTNQSTKHHTNTSTVNNTFLNANLSIQQVNIQNVAVPFVPAHQHPRFAGAGGFPMRAPGPGPAGDMMSYSAAGPMPHEMFHAEMYRSGMSFASGDGHMVPAQSIAHQATHMFSSVDPLTNLEGRVPTQKLQYFPAGNTNAQPEPDPISNNQMGDFNSPDDTFGL